MEPVTQGFGTLLNALLGTAIMVGPGLLFWGAVVGIIVAVRWVGEKLPLKRLSDPTTPNPTTIKN
jgi:hypothetical protein